MLRQNKNFVKNHVTQHIKRWSNARGMNHCREDREDAPRPRWNLGHKMAGEGDI